MWTFIIEVVLPLLGTILVGVIAWWVTNWIARPIVEFDLLRRQTREELNFWKHLSKDSKQKEQGSDALRRLSARIEAMATSGSLPRQYFKFRGYDLTAAHSNLSGLANVDGSSGDERLICRNKVELALKLPTSETPERIDRINDRIERDR